MTKSPNRYNAATLIDRNLDAGRADKIAVLSETGELTYRELFDQIVSMGSALKSLGCQRENRVLLVLNDSPAFPVAFFGAMRIGAVPVPVNPLYKAADYRYFLEDSYARIVVTDSQSLSKVRRAVEGHMRTIKVIVADQTVPADSDFLSMEELLASSSGEQSPVDTHADDIAFWLYSSGSTGRPKGVVHLHRAIPATCETFASHILHINPEDILFGRALFHAYGLGNALTFPLSFGASTVLMAGRPTAENILNTIERFRPTIVGLVPTLFNLILNGPANTSRDLSSIRFCISAAEPLPPDIWRRWRDTFGITILDGIGTTEMLHMFCSNGLDGIKPGSSGRCVPGYDLKILDDEGLEVNPGETGNLFVKGPSAAPFYWHQREKSLATMRGEWMSTGDRYRMDSDGFFWYEGRADDMLKINGEWVSPIEIENVLMEHPAVYEVAVIGAPVDGIMRVKATVVLMPEKHPSEGLEKDLQFWCKERLQRFKYPHFIEFVQELPRTATGKIQRYQLRAQESESALPT